MFSLLNKPAHRDYRFVVGLLLLALLSGAAQVQAEVQFRGFATLGVTHSDAEQLEFRSSYLNKPHDGYSLLSDSVIGGQLNYRINTQFDAVVQAVIQDRGDDQLGNYIEMAFVRYQADRNWSFRLGRMSYNAYLLSEFRHVGYAYTWARPPVDFYFPPSSVSFINGGEIQYRSHLNDGVLQTTLAVGDSKARFYNFDTLNQVDFDYIVNATTSYEKGNWLFKGSASYFHAHDMHFNALEDIGYFQGLAQIPELIWPGVAQISDDLQAQDEGIGYLALGMQYDDGDWLVMSELGGMDTDWALLLSTLYGYVSVGYHFDTFTPYVTVSAVKNLSSVPELPEPRYSLVQDAQTQESMALAHTIGQRLVDVAVLRQKTLSAGVRWDFASAQAFKLQWDHYRVESPGYAAWGSDFINPVVNDQSINVLSASFSTVF